MRAGQVMTKTVVSISPDATVYEAAERLVGSGVSAMPVIDGAGHMIGIVSEADLMRRSEIGTEPRKSWLERMFSDGATTANEYVAMHARHVADVMSAPVVTVQEDDTLAHVAAVMIKHQVKRVPVVRSGDMVVGILSRTNLVQALLSRDPRALGPDGSDDIIRREVEMVVAKQSWTSPWPTNVVVESGIVHLWGLVPNEDTSRAYRVAAENVPGVKKVKNHLRAMPLSTLMGV
jgi:CBS domain-containing protein